MSRELHSMTCSELSLYKYFQSIYIQPIGAMCLFFILIREACIYKHRGRVLMIVPIPKLANGTHGTKHSYNNHPWLEIYNVMHVELNHFFVACGRFLLNFLLLVVISLETLVRVYI
jgi:hypothetical protein